MQDSMSIRYILRHGKHPVTKVMQDCMSIRHVPRHSKHLAVTKVTQGSMSTGYAPAEYAQRKSSRYVPYQAGNSTCRYIGYEARTTSQYVLTRAVIMPPQTASTANSLKMLKRG